MFSEKAINIWVDSSEYGRIQLVKSYFMSVHGFSEPEVIKRRPLPPGARSANPANSFSSVIAEMWSNFDKLLNGGNEDPFYAVVAYKLKE